MFAVGLKIIYTTKVHEKMRMSYNVHIYVGKCEVFVEDRHTCKAVNPLHTLPNNTGV